MLISYVFSFVIVPAVSSSAIQFGTPANTEMTDGHNILVIAAQQTHEPSLIQGQIPTADLIQPKRHKITWRRFLCIWQLHVDTIRGSVHMLTVWATWYFVLSEGLQATYNNGHTTSYTQVYLVKDDPCDILVDTTKTATHCCLLHHVCIESTLSRWP